MMENIKKTDLKEIILEYIDKKCLINAELKEEIYNEILDLLSNNKDNKLILSNWELLEIKFNNLYGYGENNIIDFSKYNKSLIGLSAPNSYGKSTLVDIITFSLFSSSKYNSGIPDDIININEKYGDCEVTIKAKGKIYLITKKIAKKTQNVELLKNSFKIYELIYDNIYGNYIFNKKLYIKKDISKYSNTESEKFIRELIGTKKDFVYTCISLQSDNISLKDMKQAEKKKNF